MNAGKISALRAESFPEPELTPAASEKLDQNMATVRLQILREISRQYGASDHRARASDVDSAVSRIGFFGSASRIVSRTTVLAIALASVSLLAQVLSQIIKPGKPWLVTGVALLVGITSGTTLVVIIQETRRRKRIASVSGQEFIHAFNRLEDSMRNHARELIGPADSTSLGRVISAMELLQLWTPEDSQIFRRLLSTRNSIVHEDGRVMSAETIASAFSKVARLSSLLDISEGSSSRHPIKELATNRAALSFEESVSNALRQAGISVVRAQGDVSYDLLAGKSDLLKRVVIKHRQRGILTVNDIEDTVDHSPSSIPTVIVTNAAISPYVLEYLELARDSSSDKRDILAIRWQNNNDTATLVQAIITENAGL
jgi:hypothetical protein